MGKKGAIPREIKDEVERIVEEFRQIVLKNRGQYYLVRFRGRFLYPDRFDYGRIGPICRMEYRGGMDNWKFSIYKFSSGNYDSEEWFFPGSDLVDGRWDGGRRYESRS